MSISMHLHEKIHRIIFITEIIISLSADIFFDGVFLIGGIKKLNFFIFLSRLDVLFRSLGLFLIKELNLFFCSEQPVELKLIHITLGYVICLSIRLSFLLHLYQIHDSAFLHFFYFSSDPARFYRNKFLLIQLYNFKTNFIIYLANKFITRLFPSFQFLFLNRNPLVLFMLFESFLDHLVS